MKDLTIQVIKGLRHKEYYRTVEIAHFYTQVVDGIGQGELVLSLRDRESEAQQIQRLKVTQNRTKAIYGKLESFLKRVYRTDKINLDVKTETETGQQLINSSLSKYGNNGETLLQYSEDLALFMNGKDPNALYWVKHERINNIDTFEPVVFNSDCALYYEKTKGALNNIVLIDHLDAQYLDGASMKYKNICIYYTFTAGVLDISVEIDADLATKSDFYKPYEVYEKTSSLKIGNKIFNTYSFELESENIPVTTIGYKKDRITDGNTFVSFWDDSTELFKQLINVGSQYDISLILHTFLQKIQLYTPCDYIDSSGAECRAGYMHPSNKLCTACNGTGKKVHTSAQDVIEIEYPDDDTVKILPKDLVSYVTMPFDIVQHQANEVYGYPSKITEAVYGIDLTHKPNAATTATANQNFYDTAYDMMFEFTKAPTHIFKFTVDIIAQVLNLNRYSSNLVYSNNFNLETEYDLFTLREAAVKAGATPETLEAIDKRILTKQNKNNAEYMAIFKAMRKFLPFSNLGADLKKNLVLSLPDKNRQKTLYLNFNEITNDILANRKDFVLLDYNAQKNIIESYIEEYKERALNDNTIVNIRDRVIEEEA
tara:strand:+ start:11153 stop:12946 length:1794 start_codon:yes stop_codon:yes gene_type:complete